jgi:hypothetical protein
VSTVTAVFAACWSGDDQPPKGEEQSGPFLLPGLDSANREVRRQIGMTREVISVRCGRME